MVAALYVAMNLTVRKTVVTVGQNRVEGLQRDAEPPEKGRDAAVAPAQNSSAT
jgi:hypothetical protein